LAGRTRKGFENGYYELEIGHVVDMLNECGQGEGYKIKREKIKALTYHNLPEFEGF